MNRMICVDEYRGGFFLIWCAAAWNYMTDEEIEYIEELVRKMNKRKRIVASGRKWHK